jgi:RNA polymerase sigma factor (sigma-70 family)
MSTAMPSADRLDDRELYRLLSAVARRKIPRADVEDLVQSTLADALASPQAPEDEEDLRRWVLGIARNKIADYYRRGRREVPHEPLDLDLVSRDGKDEPHSARDMLRWAEGALPENQTAKETFDWMIREGQGEKLEAIAEEERLPAPQVRKRVSRLRQHLKRMWAVELGAVAAIAIAVGLGLHLSHKPPTFAVHPDSSTIVPNATRAAELRRSALERCRAGDARGCLDDLDRAREIDRAGDSAEEIQRARQVALGQLEPRQLPAVSPSASPSAAPTAAPPRRPRGSKSPIPSKSF